MCFWKRVTPSEYPLRMPLLKRHFFAQPMTIHSRATGYIQSSRVTMPVLIRPSLIANLKRMPSSL